VADEATIHNPYDQIADLGLQPNRISRVRGARLRVVAMTEETASRHWLKILACAA
jgi:hypothetical protein